LLVEHSHAATPEQRPVYPGYSYPKDAIIGLIIDALRGHPRSFAADARSCVKRLRPGLRLLGAEQIPAGASYVITPNHYHRPGYQAQWTALAISASIPGAVHWVMTGELTFPGKWYAPIAVSIDRFVLSKIARVYGFTTMPAMPPHPRELAARAVAVRGILRYSQHVRHAVIGLAPEGGDQPGSRLSMPPSGVGKFCLRLAAAGLMFLPVGVYESGGALTLQFGAAYALQGHSGPTTRGNDRLAARTVMQHIAALLPIELRGEFC
jgi:hypothetical protein